MIEAHLIGFVEISRIRFLRAMRKMGFVEDYITKDVTVLRRMTFPFNRLAIPNDESLSVELVKLYLKDLRLSWEEFYNFYLQES